jgi:hypothetical protein
MLTFVGIIHCQIISNVQNFHFKNLNFLQIYYDNIYELADHK